MNIKVRTGLKKIEEDWKQGIHIPEGWMMKIHQKEVYMKDGEGWKRNMDILDGWMMKEDQKESEKKDSASNQDQEITTGKIDTEIS